MFLLLEQRVQNVVFFSVSWAVGLAYSILFVYLIIYSGILIF